MLDGTLRREIERRLAVVATILLLGAASAAIAQQGGATQTAPDPQDAMTRKLLARLDLEKYKATIKGLTQFGDRRQGTERNRKAVDWIEAQLRSYGCPTERLRYVYDPPAAGRARPSRRPSSRSSRAARCVSAPAARATAASSAPRE